MWNTSFKTRGAGAGLLFVSVLAFALATTGSNARDVIFFKNNKSNRGLLSRGGERGPVGASPRPSELNETRPVRPPFNGTRPDHNGTFPERPPFNGTRPPCNGTVPAPGNDTRPPSSGRGEGGRGRGLLSRGGERGPVGASRRPSELNETRPVRPPFNGTRPDHNGTFPERPPFNGTRPPCNGTLPLATTRVPRLAAVARAAVAVAGDDDS